MRQATQRGRRRWTTTSSAMATSSSITSWPSISILYNIGEIDDQQCNFGAPANPSQWSAPLSLDSQFADDNLYYDSANPTGNTSRVSVFLVLAEHNVPDSQDLDSHFADPKFVGETGSQLTSNQFQLQAGSPGLTGGTSTWSNAAIQEAWPIL